MINRRKGWREVQPVFKGRLGPSKAAMFKSPGNNAPKGVAPLQEAPTAPGWWVCKQPTAQRPYLDYFTAAQLGEQIAAGEDSQVAFYPWTPITLPERLRCKKMKVHAKTSGNTTSTGEQ